MTERPKLGKRRGRSRTAVVRLPPDPDTPRTRVLLNKIASQDGGELAEAARGCLDQLKRMDEYSNSTRKVR